MIRYLLTKLFRKHVIEAQVDGVVVASHAVRNLIQKHRDTLNEILDAAEGSEAARYVVDLQLRHLGVLEDDFVLAVSARIAAIRKGNLL